MTSRGSTGHIGVQYKRAPFSGRTLASLDDRLDSQLDHMVRLDGQGGGSTTSTSLRLGDGGFTFVKFVRDNPAPDNLRTLLRGRYVPSSLLHLLREEGSLRGPQGGLAVTEDNTTRWLDARTFAALVHHGWLGSRTLGPDGLAAWIAAELRDKRSVMLAASGPAPSTG